MENLQEQKFSLTFQDRYEIKYESEGLSEPSGLALSRGKNALWTISDDTKKIFKLSLKGDLKKKKSFKIKDKGLEGIALDPTGQFLLTVREDNNQIIKINIETQKVVKRRKLSEMKGFDAVEQYFSVGKKNKGLEGITCNKETQTIFVMKEGSPGLLLEISSDLKTILKQRLLNEENGFSDPEVKPDKLDFSGICYDHIQKHFWIISDKAKRLFLYDWEENKVIQDSELGYRENGEYKKIKKVEGVALDADTNRLYLVSDKKAQLYVFEINN